MFRIWSLAAIAARLLLTTTLDAQRGDSVYSRRGCNKRLSELRMPVLSELGDSVRFADLLSRGADPQAHITWVELSFGRDGALRRLEAKDARSSSARTLIKDSMRASVNSIGAYPREFRVNLVRFNTTGEVRLLAETATCEPDSHQTPAAAALIREIHRNVPESHVHRDAIIQFVLESDGQVSDAWIRVSTGVSQVDSLAMQIFRVMRFDPAIVGQTPVAALVQQPYKF